jgi:hypothetical protein
VAIIAPNKNLKDHDFVKPLSATIGAPCPLRRVGVNKPQQNIIEGETVQGNFHII